MNLEVSKMRRLYFVGIKGVAMAALAIWAKEAGKVVAGSDVGEEFPTDDELKDAGIAVHEGFDEAHLVTFKPDLVIYTGAHGGWHNPEVQAALKAGIPAIPHGRALGLVTDGHRLIAVAGSHGKTTTSAMIATTLSLTGKDPSYAIGCGSLKPLGAAGRSGRGEWFVVEADEYVTDPGHDPTPRFHWLQPEVLVVTNIDYDHPDAYPSLSAVQEAFTELTRKQVGEALTIVNSDDPASRPLLKVDNIATYGFSPTAQFHISHIGFGQERTFFTLEQQSMLVAEFSLRVPGKHNALNAVAAAVACYRIGLSWEEIRTGLLAFGGTKRRFEKLGEGRGITFFDDYAHHPAEIVATLAAARVWYPKRRIVVVFQPHTYSRTRALLSEFGRAFGDADIVAVTDIFASARETDNLGITGATLVEEVAKHHARVFYTKDEPTVGDFLNKTLQAGDIVFFMGAGDIYLWGRRIIEAISDKYEYQTSRS